jgi:large subunit ribosomal protein L25
MEKITLKAKERTGLGKGPSKHLRKEGFIPAIVYHRGEDGIKMGIDRTDLWHALHTSAGENAIISLDIEGGEDGKGTEKTVIVKEVQKDPINDSIIHVDFQEISLKEKIQVSVPVVLKGEAKGVTEEGGVLSQLEWELEVECLPTDIPESIEIHVEDLMIGDAIHIEDVKLEGDYVFLAEPDQVIVTVTPPQELEEEEEEGLEEGAGEEPELIKKGKKEEEEEEGAEEEPAEEE